MSRQNIRIVPLLRRAACAACLPMVVLLGSVAQACPEKIPSGMKAVSVGEGLSVNAIGVSILQVEGREKMPTLLKRMSKEWQDAGYAVRLNQAEGWQVVSALSEKCLTTLQLIERDGSFGYMAVNRLAKPIKARLPALPLPRGARIISDVLSDDDGRRASTMVLAASQPVAQLASYYQQVLKDARWSGVRTLTGADNSDTPSRATVSGQLGRERVEIVIVQDGGAKVVINMATEL
jgi:hypothetical protein